MLKQVLFTKDMQAFCNKMNESYSDKCKLAEVAFILKLFHSLNVLNSRRGGFFNEEIFIWITRACIR